VLGFLAKRLASGVVLVFAVSAAAFVLISIAGGDIARTIVGDAATQEQVDQKAAELGLDRPLLEQYWSWLGSAVHGDFGTSWFTNLPVSELLLTKMPITLSLALVGTLVSAVLGIALGTIAAVRRGVVDRLLQVLVIGGFALPGFWLALVLVSAFAVRWGVLPATGYVPFGSSPSEWARSIALPVAALAIGVTGATAQQVRSALIDVLRQDYVRSLRGRGLSSANIVLRHGLRNAAPSALTVISLQFINLLGGAVIIERIFALPGLGAMTLDATTQGDVPQIMGVVVLTVGIVVSVNLVIDVAYGWLNPKVRIG